MSGPLDVRYPAGYRYRAQSARDAQATGYGERRYWDYLEAHAHELRDAFLRRGEPELAASMLTRSLAESLRGNDGP